ncbi:MAG TPA: tRNA guanosine(34) transglycosylase Tgt [Planctomycetota bacterium]|nr:tRNA guanosine(34) transglycosylase Tgt [Planctomycetota bacterium]
MPRCDLTKRPLFGILTGLGAARAGWLDTPHGRVETPAFMPVGTQGAVKALLPSQLEAVGVQMLLGNTYHLHLRPGEQVVARLGGLHGFMGWSRPILTDSGGFQVFSLAELRRVTDDGVEFQSHIDGARITLTPEKATEIQNVLGPDILMAFDECAPYPCERDAAEVAMRRSIAWAARCQKAHGRPDDQALFAIVQGGVFEPLRVECAQRLVDMDFPGYAVGGVSVGEGDELMYRVLDATLPHLPADKPRYLMGVGTPINLIECIERGVDLFDCVLPTRNGRSGHAFTARGVVRLRNLRHRDDPRPLDPTCDCAACRGFSRGYLRHLFHAREIAAAVLTSLHNVAFYQRLVRGCRQAILEGRLAAFKSAFLDSYSQPENTERQ